MVSKLAHIIPSDSEHKSYITGQNRIFQMLKKFCGVVLGVKARLG